MEEIDWNNPEEVEKAIGIPEELPPEFDDELSINLTQVTWDDKEGEEKKGHLLNPEHHSNECPLVLGHAINGNIDQPNSDPTSILIEQILDENQ